MNLLDYPVTNPFQSQVPAGFYDPVKGHTGTDFSMADGTPLSLPFATTVRAFYAQEEMGNTLYLEDSNHFILVFAHLSEVLVEVGMTLEPGSIFAKSGNTGTKSEAPHLHLEIIAQEPELGYEIMTRSLRGFNGYNIDPLHYLSMLSVLSELPAQEVEAWAEEAFLWAQKEGLIKENHNLDATPTWGEFLTVLKRFSERA